MSVMKKIMIIDDDAELRSHMENILSNEGYQTVTSESAKDFLEQTDKQALDIILLDFMMPGINGIDALLEIRKRFPKTRVVMITAFASIENAVEAMKKGASDYISKPFKIADLLMSIRRVIEEAKFEERVDSLELNQTLNAIVSTIRRNILKLLYSSGPSRLMEITRELEIEDHTKVVFHLKILKEAGIVEQDQDKVYSLTGGGFKTMECLKTMEHMILH